MRGHECPTEGTGLCPGHEGLCKAFKQWRSKTRLGSGPVSMAMGASWTGDQRIESGRPEAAVPGNLLLPTALQGGMAQSTEDQEVAGPTLPESSPWVPRDGLSSCLTLCFSSGSECATSCLDHNSESIILPVNVTVRDIPHWLNPTRVEVSDRGCPLAAMGREMTMVNIYCALVLH